MPYTLAVAPQDRSWHHEASYTAQRATRPDTVALWRKIATVEDPAWTARYHAAGAGPGTDRHRAAGKRVQLRDRLASGALLQCPGAFNPLSALRTPRAEGALTARLGQMLHRRDLYDLLDYEGDNRFDGPMFDFRLAD